MAARERCPGCGVELAAVAGPVHAYLGASAACWDAYGRLLAREYEDPAYFAAHQDTVDAYAAQHPGIDGRRQRQSVAVHLITLCLTLEHGRTPDELPAVRRRIVGATPGFPWLEPPPPGADELRVTDVLDATDAAAHAALTRRWAVSVWDRWAPHHATIRGWVTDAS